MNYRLMTSFILCSQLLIYALPLAADSSPIEYTLKDGKLCKVNNQYEAAAVEGGILAISRDGEVINYIRDAGGVWYAGKFDIRGEQKSEYLLGNNFTKLHKLSVCGNIFFFLADAAKQVNGGSQRVERILTRFDPESAEQKTIIGVHDFILMGSELIVLDSSGVNCNGAVIPAMISGEIRVDKFIDGRLLFITNGNDVEVLDLLAQRNIYQYRAGAAYPYSSEYNIMLEFSDSVIEAVANNPEESMVYYQINLNGFDAGRTETSPAEIIKSSMLKAETGKYCVIKAERWELDKDKGRYVRVNNVRQPGELRIYMPENRIIKIRINFNGTEYSISQSVYVN